VELLRGVVHGRMIELESESRLPEGQLVTLVVQAADSIPDSGGVQQADSGLRRAFGAWADDAAELDEYLEWNRQQRKIGRTRDAEETS
jgi:hypothetical protein